MGKQICCDICNKILTKKEGIRFIEITKIEQEDFENYPEGYSSNIFFKKDMCLSCSQKIEREINRIIKIKEVRNSSRS